MAESEKHGFQTEVKQLLHLLAHSLYSNKEVFLRELISNASDAIDKLRFTALEDASVYGDDTDLHIRLSVDKENKTLTISDNGIGMTKDEAIEHLGTIAKSGTADFFKNLTGDQTKDSQLIGQFGVGFYSAFIVADKVTVVSRSAKANADEAVCWESDGSGEFTVTTVNKEGRGTDIILSLREEEKSFLEDWSLRSAISKYSDHISVPVEMLETVKVENEEGETDDKSEVAECTEWKQVNDAKALWTRNPKEITDEECNEFYKHITHDYQDPLAWSHNKVEGSTEYTSLLYVPKQAPFDLFNRDVKRGLKLYVQRVFIMDDAEQFMPGYLRFIKGVLDSNDLPLNVSREILQDNKVSAQLKKACTKKSLQMLAKLSKDDDKTKYQSFWKNFGNVLKEGLVEDFENRDDIFGLLRFASTNNDSEIQDVSLADYISRMPEKQKHIYYITADSYKSAANSPYLEVLKKKGVEVLLMWERIDEWVMNQVSDYKDKKFIAVTSKDLELGELEDKEDKEKQEAIAKEAEGLVERVKNALGDDIKEVKVSTRLVDTPSCVISDNNMMTNQMRRLFEASGQKLPEEKYTLEINPEHALVKKMAEQTDDAKFKEYAQIIFEQALLSDQGGLKDPVGFVKRLNSLLLG